MALRTPIKLDFDLEARVAAPRERLVVDGANVVGSVPDGWWRDRAGAARALHTGLAALAASGVDVTLVLEGRSVPELPEGVVDGVAVRWATRSGRDAGDDRIVELVAADPEPTALTVVTADRALRDAVESLGASVSGPLDLRRRLGV